MKFQYQTLYSLAFLLLLGGCTQENPEPAEQVVQEATRAAAVQEAEPSQSLASLPLPANPLLAGDTRSVRQLMNEVMELNARTIWNAVSYIVTADGVEERFPRSDEEWNTLLQAARNLMSGGEALMLDSRPVDPAFDPASWPNWQYTPAEIETMRSEDPDNWRYYLVDMQGAVTRIIDAINRRDLLAYGELGVLLNQACQGCHSSFWYKPLNQVP